MAEFEFDFSGQTPVEEAGGSDRIPPAQYTFRLDSFEDGHANSGKRMVKIALSVANEGPMLGKRIQDNFVLEGVKNDFGVRRFMGFIMALGVKLPAKGVKFNTDALIGKLLLADVADETIPANGEYPDRIVSKPRTYHIPQEVKDWMNSQAAPAAPPPVAVPVAAPVAAAVAAPVAVAEPVAAAPVVAATPEPAPAPAPAPAPVASAAPAAVDIPVSASLDDLFST